MIPALLALLACSSPPPDARAVYRSGPEGKGENAVIRGRWTQPVKVWGPKGTVTRSPSEAPGGNSLLGQQGVFWRVDRDVPAVPRAFPVDAAFIERAGFKLREALGASSSGAKDAARAGGVYVRSMVKVRRKNAPPVHVVTATRDDVGAGRIGGPEDKREGAACQAILGLFDARAEVLLASVPLPDATATCAVPVLVTPVDLEGDGQPEAFVHGQLGSKGFAAWFTLEDKALRPGPSERWDSIP